MAVKAVKAVKTTEKEQVTKEKVEKKDAFQEALAKMESVYGKGSVIRGKDVVEDLEIVPTGSIGLNLATNIGGLPMGKCIEVFGAESSGKSTLSLDALAGFQKLEGECVLVDYEQSFDRIYATALGVQVDKLTILQPDCMEDGYNQIEALIKTGKVRLVVIDSHTAGQPKKVIEGLVGDDTVGLQARRNSIALGKIKPLLRANRCTLLAISQIRQAVGSMGEVNQPTGGLAYRFYSDMRIKLARVQTDKAGERNKTEISIIKNKCAAPWGVATVFIDWGKGYDRMGEIIDWAVEFKLITVGGSWYTLIKADAEREIPEVKVQGLDKVKAFMNDNTEWYTQLEIDILEKLKAK